MPDPATKTQDPAATAPDGVAPPATAPDVIGGGSLSQLLFAVMKHIGGWAPEQILIEQIPTDLFDRLAGLAARNVEEGTNAKLALGEFFATIIGEGNFGGGGVVDPDLSNIDGSVPEQVYKVGISMGVNPNGKLMLSAMMTGLTETPIDGGKSFGNPVGGDQTGVPGSSPTRQSSGWRQETVSSYPNVDRNNVPQSAKRYFSEGQALIEKGKEWPGTAGQLSHAIQRSAYPDKADKVRNEALALLRKVADKVGGSGDTPKDDSTKDEEPDSNTRNSDSTKDSEPGDGKFYSPIRGLKMQEGSVPSVPAGVYGNQRATHKHAGLDCSAPLGTPLYAICDAVVVLAGTSAWGSEGGLITMQAKNPIPGYPGKILLGYGHPSEVVVKAGQEVKAGQIIGKSGAGQNNEPHLHFFVNTSRTGTDGNTDPTPLMKAAVEGSQPTGDVQPSSDPTTGGGSGGNPIGSAVAASLAGQIALPSALESMTSAFLGNERSLMNDVPLLPFVQQLSQASLRHFQSMPDGKFYAFYPDYFGEVKHHQPYWEIEDIEILDGKVRLTDDALVTHSFVVGDNVSPDGKTEEHIRMLHSAGIVTIFNAFTASDPTAVVSSQQKKGKPENEVDHKTKKQRDAAKEDMGSRVGGLGVLMQNEEALAFLNRYGARPVTDDQPNIHAPQFELFLAYQKFMLGWSRQFLTPFTFTFMPELYPGGKVGFPNHGFQMYIESVTHTFDYISGFTTEAQLSAPSAYGEKNKMLPTNMLQAIVEPARADVVATKKAVEAAKNKVKKNAFKGVTDLGPTPSEPGAPPNEKVIVDIPLLNDFADMAAKNKEKKK